MFLPSEVLHTLSSTPSNTWCHFFGPPQLANHSWRRKVASGVQARGGVVYFGLGTRAAFKTEPFNWQIRALRPLQCGLVLLLNMPRSS
jgi:hypothetical protein